MFIVMIIKDELIDKLDWKCNYESRTWDVNWTLWIFSTALTQDLRLDPKFEPKSM